VNSRKTLAAALLSSVVVAASAFAGPAHTVSAKRKAHSPGHQAAKNVGGPRAAVLKVVDDFEKAYQRKDKQTMIMKLMVPTQDAWALEKRYQWLRGYGPHDMPGTKHQPILFETSRGSFVPTAYKVLTAEPTQPGQWHVAVQEQGTYKDEDGRYKVIRVRQFKITQHNGKWYVLDYVLKENPEDYGFWVDDIIDKMTKL